jgi:sugar phosphate isomerase/epimerase
VKRQVADAARLGATHGYVVPGTDGSADGLARFADACRLLAAFAGQRMVRMCVEHVPGRALPTAAGTLGWLKELAVDNLALLLDVGHCLITQEDPVAVIARAGGRLGYIHFDDNDGVGDLHWPLLEGRLTQEMLAEVIAALRAANYRAALALELNPNHGVPAEALARGKALLSQ